jgi:hypothetical protein
VKERLATVKAQVRQLGQIGRQVEKAPDEQVSLTDPDTRSMNSAGKGNDRLPRALYTSCYSADSTQRLASSFTDRRVQASGNN